MKNSKPTVIEVLTAFIYFSVAALIWGEQDLDAAVPNGILSPQHPGSSHSASLITFLSPWVFTLTLSLQIVAWKLVFCPLRLKPVEMLSPSLTFLTYFSLPFNRSPCKILERCIEIAASNH